MSLPSPMLSTLKGAGILAETTATPIAGVMPDGSALALGARWMYCESCQKFVNLGTSSLAHEWSQGDAQLSNVLTALNDPRPRILLVGMLASVRTLKPADAGKFVGPLHYVPVGHAERTGDIGKLSAVFALTPGDEETTFSFDQSGKPTQF